MPADKRFLILGGAGLVGSRIVREIARELHPEQIVVASLYRGEVREFVHEMRREFPHVNFIGAWGDVFLREEFRLERRMRLLQSRPRREMLFDDLYGELSEAYGRSGLVQLVEQHRPDVIVDSINTATAISYQDVHALSQKTYEALQTLEQIVDHQDLASLSQLGKDLQQQLTTLLISLSVPQLIRHVQMLHRAMINVGTRLYVKIGTTGTGGMGLNIPYTHSEDKPSAKLMSKTAVAFAHTGLLFLMARTPGGPLVKEIKPAAMIGYRNVTYKTIKRRGRPQVRYESQTQPLNGSLVLRGQESSYRRLDRLQMAVVDTGENGQFARGEFETITQIDQMEYVTPEEIARKAVLEIMGSNTGADLIAALDSSVMGPSYRAGVLREAALVKLRRLEQETASPSVALGQLGPPELSKLLYEAHLLRVNYATLQNVVATPPSEIAETLYEYILHEPHLRTTITSVGIPILTPDGRALIRGPLINIPERLEHEVTVDQASRDIWARKGWLDLRPANFRLWQTRFEQMLRAGQALGSRGSAAVTRRSYPYEAIEIGAVVAWIFTNEDAGYRIK